MNNNNNNTEKNKLNSILPAEKSNEDNKILN